MNPEVTKLVQILKNKLVDGIDKLETLDVTTDMFQITLANIVQASNIIAGIEQSLAEMVGPMPMPQEINEEVIAEVEKGE